MVRYPLKKPEAQNIVPEKSEKNMKKNKNFFRVSLTDTAIFVEFDEKSISIGMNIKSSGNIAKIPQIPFIPKTLKNDESVYPNKNPRFAITPTFNNTPNLKNEDINNKKNIKRYSFTA